MNHVEFQQQGMLPDFGAGYVRQGELVAVLLVKEPSERQVSHSAEAVGRNACNVCALVADHLLALGAENGK